MPTEPLRSGVLNRIIEYSLKNRLLVVFAIGLASIVGLLSYAAMETDLFPDLSSPIITVIAENPTLAAQEGETLIARPLESAFRSLPNVIRVRSESEMGVVSVRTEFRFGTDYYLARQLLAERLSAAARSFPAGTTPPVMSSAASRLGEVLQFYIAQDRGEVDTKELKEVADYLIRYKLQTVPGVVRVTSHGGERRQFEVVLDRARMASYGIALSEVIQALGESNENFSGSFIVGIATEMDVRGLGRIHSLEDLRSVVVAVRNGIPVLVKDIAEVRDGSAIRRGIVRANGREAVLLTVAKQFGTDTLTITSGAKKAISELKGFLPSGISLVTVFDQSELINVATKNLEEALFIGGIAVVLIIFLFLGNLRSTIIAAVTIPVAVVISFVFLKWSGVTLNIMTLGGLAVGLGIMVDAAIVDTENIFRHLKSNPQDSFWATLRGASEVRRPAAYSTFIIIVVFLPLLFLSGLEGKILSPFALTVIVLMVVGLVLSLTLTPALCYTLLRRVASTCKEDSWLARKCEGVYEPILRRSLAHRWSAVGVAAGFFAASLLIFPFLGTELLPRMDEGALLLQMSTPPGTSLIETDRVASQVTTVLKGGRDIAAIVQPTGRADRSEDPMPVTVAEHIIKLVPRSERKHSIPEIEAWVRDRLRLVPGVSAGITTPLNMRIDESISGTSAALAVKIFGPNLDTLVAKGAQLKRLLEQVEGVVDVRIEPLAGVPQVVVAVDRARAARFGLNPGQLGDSIEALLAGLEVTTVLKDQIKEYPVVVRLPEQQRSSPADVENLSIDTPTGQKILLSDVATVRVVKGPAVIKREDQVRRIQVSVNVQGTDVGSVVAAVENRLPELNLPDGYYLSYGGGYERQQELTREITNAFVISALLVFLLLFLAFRSVSQALLVITTIPLALAGGFLALWLTQSTLNVSSMIGLLAHFGLSVQKGLILVEYINQLRERGYSVADATYIGARTRMRPVLMTASAAGLGVLPIAVGWGAGAELQQPLAIALVGGLVTSTILTLIALPALYRITESNRDWLMQWWIARKPAATDGATLTDPAGH